MHAAAGAPGGLQTAEDRLQRLGDRALRDGFGDDDAVAQLASLADGAAGRGVAAAGRAALAAADAG